MKPSFALRIAAAACVASLAPGCKKAPEVPDAAPGIVVESEVITNGRWVIAAVADVRAAPDAGAPTTSQLPIGTKVLLLEQGDGGWGHVRTVKGEGWLSVDQLVAEPPTVQHLVAQHDAVPADNVAERRLWAERAVALEPKDIDALERLLALTGPAEGAFEQVQKGLAAVYEVPASATTAVILADSTPLVLSPEDTRPIRTMSTGDLVLPTGQAGKPGWVHVRVVGRLGWVQEDHLLALSEGVPAPAAAEGSADPKDKVALLLGPGFQERLSKNPSVHSRRNAARHLLRFVAVQAAGGQTEQAAAAQLWRTLQADADAEVRRAGSAEALAHAWLPTAPPFQEQLREVIGKLPPGTEAAEREQLAELVRRSGAQEAAKLLAALGISSGEDAGVAAAPTDEEPPKARAESAPPPATPAEGKVPPPPAPGSTAQGAEKPAGKKAPVVGSTPGHE